jgi:uncharacterized membrane protein
MISSLASQSPTPSIDVQPSPPHTTLTNCDFLNISVSRFPTVITILLILIFLIIPSFLFLILFFICKILIFGKHGILLSENKKENPGENHSNIQNNNP